MKAIFNKLNYKLNEHANEIHDVFKLHGIDFATGVPCGVQKNIIYNLINDPDIIHISATREAEAIGIAAGAYLAGKKPVVYMQNSGLFNCSNDIASLLIPYKIPIFLSITWRGCPGEDAPQHLITGKATISLLKSINIPYFVIEKSNRNDIINKLSLLFEKMEINQVPVVILLKRGWNK
ncbi:MAG: sulfopyruvate decarboxylase subunit alpha [Candidatus Lokiarchaeota archaeon]|nr:sulfopyruvate decarboxylase subunit alpha [Candidatus Lokiarchaeota archaeon]